jgi:hypothetical protein
MGSDFPHIEHICNYAYIRVHQILYICQAYNNKTTYKYLGGQGWGSGSGVYLDSMPRIRIQGPPLMKENMYFL